MQAMAREVPVEERVYRYAAAWLGDTPQEATPRRRSPPSTSGGQPAWYPGLDPRRQGGSVAGQRKAVAIDDIRKVAYPLYATV